MYIVLLNLREDEIKEEFNLISSFNNKEILIDIKKDINLNQLINLKNLLKPNNQYVFKLNLNSYCEILRETKIESDFGKLILKQIDSDYSIIILENESINICK